MNCSLKNALLTDRKDDGLGDMRDFIGPSARWVSNKTNIPHFDVLPLNSVFHFCSILDFKTLFLYPCL